MQLSARQPDGATLRQHLQAAAAASGRADPRLLHQPPAAARALWDAFVELNAGRPVGMAAGAIALGEIEAWQRLHRVRLTPWEVSTLLAMDRATLAEGADQQRDQQRARQARAGKGH